MPLTRMTEEVWGFVRFRAVILVELVTGGAEELAFDGEQRRFLPHPPSARSASADRPFSELLRSPGSPPPFARKSSYPLPAAAQRNSAKALSSARAPHGSHLGFRAIRKPLFPVKLGVELYAASGGGGGGGSGALVVLFAVSRFSGASAAAAAQVALPPSFPQTGSLTHSLTHS